MRFLVLVPLLLAAVALATATMFRARLRRWTDRVAARAVLRYRARGYNRLLRDLYGALAFPLQVTILLSRPGVDFSGGEFLLVEDRPRSQARGDAIALERGEMVIFPVRERPLKSGERTVRAVMRHGVSRIRSGERYALGIIFHDAA